MICQARNGVISHAFLTAALKAVHERRACIFATCIDEKAAFLSSQIRVALSKFREVKKGSKMKDVIVARAPRLRIDATLTPTIQSTSESTMVNIVGCAGLHVAHQISVSKGHRELSLAT